MAAADLTASGKARREADGVISLQDAAQRRPALELAEAAHREKPGADVQPRRPEKQSNGQQTMGEQSKSGARVHIGTVEIRAILPQPSRPTAVAPPAQESRNSPGRPSGPAEPLARGLAWSYGLVQG